MIWKGKRNHLQALIGSLFCTWAKTVQQFFRWACQPSRCMPLSFRGKGPEKWAGPSNQHKQSLKALFQNPSWKGNEFGKENGVTGAHRMLHAGYRANRILNSTERPWAADDEYEMYMLKKKRHIFTLTITPFLFPRFNLELMHAEATLAVIIVATGHCEKFRFYKLLCL